MATLLIEVSGKHSTIDYLRTRLVGAIEDEAAEWNSENEDDECIEVGWEFED